MALRDVRGRLRGGAQPRDELDDRVLLPPRAGRRVRQDHRCRAGRARRVDSAIGDKRPYGGAWEGPIFILTHHPEDARHAEDVTILSCPVDEALQIALDAAGGKNVGVLSPTIGRQLLQLGLIDEIDLHITPILLGHGVRLYDNPGSAPIRLNRVGDSDPGSAVNVRYRPSSHG